MAAENTIAYYDTATKSFPVEAKKSFEEKRRRKRLTLSEQQKARFCRQFVTFSILQRQS
jgi:hypothetical protein